uniref:FAM194 C-terminal domain-containing protein n=1 Tax=Capitella teleta TaxID=283909 RepID=X1ZGW7_CAPTE
KRSLILKYYDDGHKFITLFPDGTGTVLYPSGRVAITISSVELGLYTYIAQDDTPDQNVLAVFKSDGHAICNYYHHGTVRLHLDQIGGIELDQKGGRRRKWHWKEQIEHVHAPPIQPITFALSPIISVRLKGQESISLTFTYAKYSCRFQVGARLKAISRQPTQIGEVSFKEINLRLRK